MAMRPKVDHHLPRVSSQQRLSVAFRRSFYLIKGKWWSTFGLYVVISFVTGIINYLFIIPFYALMMGKMLLHWQFDTELLSVAAMSIYALGWVFTAVLPLVAMLFQYFNLVERREGVGLRQLIGQLGKTAAPQVSSAAYRPDEEGEY
jgi:cellulose synthase/poly-beta-1,6-N-acetylglucosamine synthase-like glycosyltransferase